jgi:hypothetical protein
VSVHFSFFFVLALDLESLWRATLFEFWPQPRRSLVLVSFVAQIPSIFLAAVHAGPFSALEIFLRFPPGLGPAQVPPVWIFLGLARCLLLRFFRHHRPSLPLVDSEPRADSVGPICFTAEPVSVPARFVRHWSDRCCPMLFPCQERDRARARSRPSFSLRFAAAARRFWFPARSVTAPQPSAPASLLFLRTQGVAPTSVRFVLVRAGPVFGRLCLSRISCPQQWLWFSRCIKVSSFSSSQHASIVNF